MPTTTRRRFLSTLAGAYATSVGGLKAFANQRTASSYADTILKEPGLLGFWRLDNDLTNIKDQSSGKMLLGQPSYAESAIGEGHALRLANQQLVLLSDAPELDATFMSLEFFFRVDALPTDPQRTCLIAKSDTQNRYQLHLLPDLDGLRYLGLLNIPTTIHLPDYGRLELGRWYHFALTNGELDLRAYIDGVECVLTGGALGQSHHASQPLLLGGVGRNESAAPNCVLDDVAVYDRALPLETIASHVDAAGWADRRRRLAEQVAIQQRARQQARDAAWNQRLNDPVLIAPGQQRRYEGEHLPGVSFVLGGIGTGPIQINGQARRHVWQIFNNYEYVELPHTFFAIRAQQADKQPVVRVLQTVAEGPFSAMTGLSMRGEHPFAWYDFDEPALPVRVSLEAFTPLVPFNAKDSAIPCAIFRVTLTNPGSEPVDASLLATQQNAVGSTGKTAIDGRKFSSYGGNRTEVVRVGAGTYLHLTSDGDPHGRYAGDMALAVLDSQASATASWTSLDELHGRFLTLGDVTGPNVAGPSPAGETIDGGLATSVRLAPGATHTATFVLAWRFPNAELGGPQESWKGAGNLYAKWWPSALAVATDVIARLEELTDQSRNYHDTLYASNLPRWLLDRLSSPVAVLRTNTCFWREDGYFGGWEGCAPSTGCCGGNCSHVWHYAQTHARLFPEIARTMREQVLDAQQEDGGLPHRQIEGFEPAIDGHCGDILGAYREHLCSADGEWLRTHWPRIKRAMDYAIDRWDTDEDGVLAGSQHNTLDGKLGGSTSWMGTLYLAALDASARMATLQGDTDAADRYQRIRRSGAKKQDQTLFNGEYYIQIPDDERREDYLDGCHIDQVLGQWWANQLGLDWIYPRDHVQSAMRALLKHNFHANFHGVSQKPRQFVHPDDPGMKMITWPRNSMPVPGMKYGDEIMTGFEYAAAATMVQNGMLREGLAVAKAVDDRYDGRLREGLTNMATGAWGYSGNPFGDDECGKFYARSLSVWSLLLACQGFHYDGPAGILRFNPIWRPDDHVSFFTASDGYGLFRQQRAAGRQTNEISLRSGQMSLQELRLVRAASTEHRPIQVTLGNTRLDATAEWQENETVVRLAQPLILSHGTTLRVES